MSRVRFHQGTRRNLYDPGSNAQQPFISGYANGEVVNLWDRSDE
jgi:hypothetical protein